MKNIVEFIINNWDILLVGCALIGSIVFLIYRDKKQVVFTMIKVLVTEAEKNLGQGTGSLKLASVVDAIYPKLPNIIKLLVTQKTLISWIETVLAAAKEEWAKNNKLQEYIQPDEVLPAADTIIR